MKKLNQLSESNFLRLFFAFVSACFLIAAFFMPDRDTMFTGLWDIMTQTCKISTNYFAMGGYAATFFNMGLVGLLCTDANPEGIKKKIYVGITYAFCVVLILLSTISLVGSGFSPFLYYRF